jgi:IS4 transposase
MKNIQINPALAVKLNPPLGVKPLTWLLLTSLPVESFEQASTILEWYVARWEVEVFFKVLKSGCKIEELQLETIDRMEPCLALYLIIAWRTLFVTKFG